MYYIRYLDDLFFGFDMAKNKALFIVKTLHSFLKSDLQLTIGGFYLRSDNIPFLGFLFKRRSSFAFLKNKVFEKFRRLKVRILRKQSLEYRRYLKLIEDLGRKVIRDRAVLTSEGSLHELSKVVSNNFFFKNLERVPWFERNCKFLNKPLKNAVLNRDKELIFRLEKWLNSCLALANSSELLEFSKLVGGDFRREHSATVYNSDT